MKNNIFNLYEYVLAKRVTKDIPKILKDLDKMQELCYNWKEYQAVADILFSINEAKTILKLHLKTYNATKDRKGKIDDKSKT